MVRSLILTRVIASTEKDIKVRHLCSGASEDGCGPLCAQYSNCEFRHDWEKPIGGKSVTLVCHSKKEYDEV